jgi:hypothetical protein
MNEQQFNTTISKKRLTLSEKVDCFNYWLKNHSPNIHLKDYVKKIEIYLSDCEIKEPATEQGLELLNYSIMKIKEQIEYEQH